MSEGALFFIFTRDFQNVERSRSETKELMSKKKRTTCVIKLVLFLAVPYKKKKREMTNFHVLLARKPPQQFNHVLL